MRPTSVLIIALLVVMLAVGGILQLRGEKEEVSATLSLAEAMGGDTTGYARAQGIRTFSFPEDHGPHPDYKTEWWYFTGNMESASGQRFGYQFTIFRIALVPPGLRDSTVSSTWATDHLYMGHFTVTDVAGNEHYAFERFSRGGAGLAGAQSTPFRVWLENWSASGAGDDAVPEMRVQAWEDEVGLDLSLRPVKPPVLQGDNGYDRKGPKEGDASYYYSITRMETSGTVKVGSEIFEVSGLSWMDREWSTSALGEGQVGWDWFSLHLSNGWDLMYYQIREEDGNVSPFSDGVLVSPGGEKIELTRDDVELEVLDEWESPKGGIYPIAWRLHAPGEDLTLTIHTSVADQELDVAVRYWEGAVDLEGSFAGVSVTGRGYVELTGYTDEEQGGGRVSQGERY